MSVTNINLELTTACPLRCKQCYCSFENPKHMPLKVAKKWIQEAGVIGAKAVALSGGETLCYPHLNEIIDFAKSKGLIVAATFSGWNFTQEVLDKLRSAGIDNICISLNGSTKEINSLTRDGFDYAITALTLLQENHFPSTTLNWVMHSNNTYDFKNVIAIAEKFDVKLIDVISFKPDSEKQMKTIPTKEQLYWVADIIRNYRGKVKIGVEPCYSQLLAVLLDTKLFGNMNSGPNRGCRAGFSLMSVNVDGSLSPCRHISYRENYDTIQQYFDSSPIISQLRACNEAEAKEPCSNCDFLYHCKPCMAINTEIHGKILWGNGFCPLQKHS